MKVYPLNRYVVERDGNGNVVEITKKELVKELLVSELDDGPNDDEKGDYKGTKDVDVYTCVKLNDGGWRWHQEANDMILPDSVGKAPKDKTPWLPLRFVTVDGEITDVLELKSSLGT